MATHLALIKYMALSNIKMQNQNSIRYISIRVQTWYIEFIKTFREPRYFLQRTLSFPIGFNVINSDRVCEWVSTAVFPVSVVIDTD